MMKYKSHLIAAGVFLCSILLAVSGKSQGNSAVRPSTGKNSAPTAVSDSVIAAHGLNLPPQARIKPNSGKNAAPVKDSLPQNPADQQPVTPIIISNKK